MKTYGGVHLYIYIYIYIYIYMTSTLYGENKIRQRIVPLCMVMNHSKMDVTFGIKLASHNYDKVYYEFSIM
jgi:hypothetical protein